VGSGFRTFTAGEVLTASNVQNYLMDQSVMVFGGSAARSSAIGTANFEEGMVSYLTDTDKVEAYNGTNWVSVAPTTSQGLTLINTTSFSGVASQSINSVFSASYKDYRILITDVIGSTTVQDLDFRLRKSGTDNTSSIYNFQYTRTAGPTYTGGRISQNRWGVGNVISTGTSNFVMDIFSPNIATTKTGMQSIVGVGATNDITIIQYVYTHDLATSADFDGFTFFPASGTMSGTVSVYGYNK
jgi:hypothetical protein